MYHRAEFGRLSILAALLLAVFLVTPFNLASATLTVGTGGGGAGHFWARSYGTKGTESTAFSVQQTSDEGYVVAGSMAGNFWVIRLDPAGNVLWQKAYGEGSILSLRQTSDSGFIIASGGRVLKLDDAGNIVWQKFYYGGQISQIEPTPNGGYIAAGNFWNGQFGSGMVYGAWLVRLDAQGGVAWQKIYGKSYGAAGGDTFFSVEQTREGGFVSAGWTPSLPDRLLHPWVLKLDATGNVTWQNAFGGESGNSLAHSVQQTSEGGYVVSGLTHLVGGEGAWLLKLDSTGSIVWQNAYGVAGSTGFSSVDETSDGGYVAAGETSAFPDGTERAFVVRVNASGGVLWERALGNGGGDEGNAVQQTSDGGYVVAAHTFSFGPGLDNAWVVKLNNRGFCCHQIQSNISPTVMVTSATVAPTNVVPVNTNVTVTATSAVAVDTQATVLTQCH